MIFIIVMMLYITDCTMPDELFLAEQIGISMDEQTIMKQVSGMLSFGDPYFDHGEKIPYKCQHGFQFSSNSNSTVPTVNCDNGQWYGGKDCTGKMHRPYAYGIHQVIPHSIQATDPIKLVLNVLCYLYWIMCKAKIC